MSTVYVLNKNGKPLMPTTRCGRVRHLLKEQKARVVTSNPFTIQLLYETDDVVQPLYLGIDPRQNQYRCCRCQNRRHGSLYRAFGNP